jgi:type IX secretion system PorP/SprF family membrane protein
MRKWPVILCFLLATQGAKGQLEPLSDQYLLNTLAINPAYSGSRDALSISMHHRNQWTGFEGAPKTLTLAMHAPLRNEKVGLGLLALNDRRGISGQTVILGNFAYRILLQQGVLSFGLASGISILSNQWDELVAVDPDDDLLNGNSRHYTQINFSLGAYYSNDRWFLGLSLPLFLSHDFSSSSGNFTLVNDYRQYNYFIHGGYLLTLSPNWKLLPSSMIRYNPSSDIQVDLNSFIIYQDKIWLGISYRSNKSVVGHLIYQVNNQLAAGYSYDMGFGKIGGYLGGSHEITLRYDFRYIIDVIGPRFF